MPRKTEEQKNKKADAKIIVEKNTKTKKKTNAAEKVKSQPLKLLQNLLLQLKKQPKQQKKAKKVLLKQYLKKHPQKK